MRCRTRDHMLTLTRALTTWRTRGVRKPAASVKISSKYVSPSPGRSGIRAAAGRRAEPTPPTRKPCDRSSTPPYAVARGRITASKAVETKSDGAAADLVPSCRAQLPISICAHGGASVRRASSRSRVRCNPCRAGVLMVPSSNILVSSAISAAIRSRRTSRSVSLPGPPSDPSLRAS
jgi:hypothetical protein